MPLTQADREQNDWLKEQHLEWMTRRAHLAERTVDAQRALIERLQDRIEALREVIISCDGYYCSTAEGPGPKRAANRAGKVLDCWVLLEDDDAAADEDSFLRGLPDEERHVALR